MIIPIDKKHRIKGTKLSWQIEESHLVKVDGERVEKWTPIKWPGTLEQTIKHLYDLKLRTSDAKTINECVDEAHRILAVMSKALSPTIKIDAAKIKGAV